ncbi:MAG: S8 family serine peptidase [bacterium]
MADFVIDGHSKIAKDKLIKPAIVFSKTADSSVFEKKHPNVVVFDIYGDKSIPVDSYDLTPDMTHGEAVGTYIKAQCPSANIIKRGKLTPNTEQETIEKLENAKTLLYKGSEEEKLLFGEDAKKIIENPDEIMCFDATIALKELAKSVVRGEKIDAVNLSMGESVRINNLAKVTGLPLTKENLSQYKNEIRKWFKNNKLPEIKSCNDRMESIEKITSGGIPFYVAAGNEGVNSVNLYSFAKGVTTVGALKEDRKTKTGYTVDNSLVSQWEQGDYPIDEVKDKNGKLIGYDINGDKKSEILAKDTSSNKSFLSLLTAFIINKAQGTSFATPTALGKYLRRKMGNAKGK